LWGAVVVTLAAWLTAAAPLSTADAGAAVPGLSTTACAASAVVSRGVSAKAVPVASADTIAVAINGVIIRYKRLLLSNVRPVLQLILGSESGIEPRPPLVSWAFGAAKIPAHVSKWRNSARVYAGWVAC